MEEKTFNREWVKTAAIIFLAVLLVLTFFSNTFLNHSLPEVATEYVSSGTITSRVRVTGTAQANSSYNVLAKQSAEILRVSVSAGDEVKTGDTLFVLGSADDSAVEQAQEQLDSLRLQYQKALLAASSADYAQEDRAIEQARTALTKAQTELAEASRSYKYVSAEMPDDSAVNAARLASDEARDAAEVAHMNYDATYADMQTVCDMVKGDHSSINMQYLAYQYEEAVKNTPLGEEPNTYINKDQYTAYIAISEAEQEYAAAYDAYRTADKAYSEACNSAVDAATATAKAEYEAAQEKVTACENTLSDLLFSLEQQKKTDNAAQQSAALDLAEQRKQIAKAEAALNKLRGTSSGSDGNTVTAAMDGVISEVKFAAGSTVINGDVLAVIEAPDLGYSLTAPVTVEQAQKLRVGEEATVSNYYWGAQLTATLTAIKPDPQNRQGGKKLVFDIKGDVTSGTSYTLSVGSKSAEYDYIVPIAALRSDSNGDFVLIIKSKSSPLGNRYYASRVNVEILARDDTNAAVSGAINAWDYVITTAAKPVADRDQVRMAD